MKFKHTGETDSNSQLIFYLGGDSADVYLDDIVLKTEVDMNPLQNGDFSSGLSNWSNYVHFDATASVESENEQAKISIVNEGNET